MAKVVGCFLSLLALALLIPGVSDGQDKQDKKAAKKDKVTKEEATPQDYANLAQMKEVIGKVAAVDVKAGTMTLTLEWSHWEPKNTSAKSNPNQQIQQLQNQIQREYEQTMRAKNTVQRQQALLKLEMNIQKLQNAGANLQNMFKVVKSTKDFDLEVMDTLKVARAELPMKFDAEGEVIQYSDAQKKKIKSLSDPPGGYTASPEDLLPGQTVKLWLSPPKKKSESTSGDAKDDKDKSTLSGTAVNRPQVRMALIQQDGDPPEPKDTQQKKKNK